MHQSKELVYQRQAKLVDRVLRLGNIDLVVKFDSISMYFSIYLVDKQNFVVEDLRLLTVLHQHPIYCLLAYLHHCIYQIDDLNEIYLCRSSIKMKGKVIIIIQIIKNLIITFRSNVLPGKNGNAMFDQ